MKLAHLTWPDVEKLSRDLVVVIPTGSCEQHGDHLPLFTDSLLVTAVCDAVDLGMNDKLILTPTLWLGASAHHLPFPGTLSASVDGYIDAVQQVVESLARHGFWKFYIVNGHGGNTSPNDIAARNLKEAYPNLLIGSIGYFEFAAEKCAEIMDGRYKEIHHACEAETSLMMHLYPDLVRRDKLGKDGLVKPVPGMTHTFEEVSERGSIGDSDLATAEKGNLLFDAAVAGLSEALGTLFSGYALKPKA